jgi:hypothetical protein
MPTIHTMDATEITNRRRALFDKYLDITNRKNIYLNEVDPNEYDPFRGGAHLLKYRGGAPSNCAIKGNDADPRLGEDPAKRCVCVCVCVCVSVCLCLCVCVCVCVTLLTQLNPAP